MRQYPVVDSCNRVFHLFFRDRLSHVANEGEADRLAMNLDPGPSSPLCQCAESPVRLIVGSQIFRVVVEAADRHDGYIRASMEEHARFKLCGQTFVVLKEPPTDIKENNDNVAARLTERELQIAILVARGDPVKRIAHRLGITDWTVKEYLRRIFAKLHVRSQAAMVYQCADLFRRLDREGRLPILPPAERPSQV
jgi:DNA-binding CsgD family transcriptional regulator